MLDSLCIVERGVENLNLGANLCYNTREIILGEPNMWLGCFHRYSRADAESMMVAVRNGNLEEVQRLVQAYPRIVNASWPFLSNQFPLSEALLRGKEEIALYLIAHGASLRKGASQHGTLLHFAAGSGLVKAAEVLIARRSDVNARNLVDHETPLHHAVSNGHIEVALLLARHGADLNARDCSGFTALQIATDQWHDGLVRKLIEAGAERSR